MSKKVSIMTLGVLILALLLGGCSAPPKDKGGKSAPNTDRSPAASHSAADERIAQTDDGTGGKQPGSNLSPRVYTDTCLSPDTPIYKDITKLIADADLVLQAKFNGTEGVKGADWYWEIYAPTTVYKGDKDLGNIRMPFAKPPTEVRGFSPEAGAEYLIFARYEESPVYPFPWINAICAPAIVKVNENGNLAPPTEEQKQIVPAIFAESFAGNYKNVLERETASLESKTLKTVVDKYDNYEDMIKEAEAVALIKFTEVERVNEYVVLGRIKEVVKEEKKNEDIVFPSAIALNQEIKPGEDYMVFLKYGRYKDTLQLCARQGAIVKADNKTEMDLIAKALDAAKGN